MKHLVRRLLVVGAVLALLGCGSAALAAEDSAISVQLDGEILTFTDAVPQVKSQRTFLPLRAVFEAMGAEVSYEDSTVTAVRGDTSLTMTPNSTEAKVVTGGQESVITMDVAPYVDPTTWRTYVPVRFAAQALGCAVGWDQDDQTVILIDTEKLLDGAVEGKSFTYMEAYTGLSQKYSTGIWDVKMDFDGGMSILNMPIALSGSASGTVADSTKTALNMNMTMDMSGLITALQQMSGEDADLSAEDLALLDALSKEGIGMQMRGDAAAGTMYMNMTGSFLEASGMDTGAWYSMDLNALCEQMGMDYADLIRFSTNLDYKSLVGSALSTVTLDDCTDYEVVKALVDGLAQFFSDGAFIQDGDVYTSSFAAEEDGTKFVMALSVTMKNNKAVGCTISLSANIPLDEEGTPLVIGVSSSLDEKGQAKASIVLDAGGFVGVDLDMTSSYTAGSKAPETTPPAGAAVVPFEQMMAGALAGMTPET